MKTNHLTRYAVLFSLTATAAMTQAQDAVIEQPKTEVKVVVEPAAVPTAKQGSLTDVVSDSVSFSTLKAALKASGLDITLGEKGTYTLFAPTDEAFDKLPAGTLGKLMLPENKEKLRSVLLYHVIPGQMLAADLKSGEVKTMNGEKVKVEIDDGKVEVDEAKVFSTDVMANNGVMHSIGNVMIPKSLDGFSGLDK